MRGTLRALCNLRVEIRLVLHQPRVVLTHRAQLVRDHRADRRLEVAVAFAFITNKIWVFKSKTKTSQETTKEAVMFIIARLVTLGVEVFLMWLMVDNFKQDKLIWKLLCNIITVILNYLFSKLIVFKEKKTKES